MTQECLLTIYQLETVPVVINLMPEKFDDFKYVLLGTCEITNIMFPITIRSRAPQVIVEVFIQRIICIFGPPKLSMVDKDSTFTGEINQLILYSISC